MPSKNELYQYDLRLARCKSLIEQMSTSSENKVVLLRFLQHCLARGLSVLRAQKLTYHARHLTLMLNKPLRNASRNDIESVVARINMRDDWSAWTRSDYRIALRLLFWFVHGCEEHPNGAKKYPDIVSWVRTTHKDVDKPIDEDALLGEEDFLKGLGACRDSLERAFVSVLFESGCRVGELLLLNRKSVKIHDGLAWLYLHGKTGRRTIPLAWSTKALQTYMREVQGGDDEPLWQARSRAKYSYLTYGAVQQILRRIKLDAKIGKRINPHFWRHSRVTLDSEHGMSDSQLCAYFGWIHGSRMLRRYNHLTAKRLAPRIHELHPEPSMLKPRTQPVARKDDEKEPALLLQLQAQAMANQQQPETRRVDASGERASERHLLKAMLDNPVIRSTLIDALQGKE